jgi:predicted heme/steroid binding protein
LEEPKKYTTSELSKFNGKNGNPAYVGYKGKVYDVTASMQWSDGDHLGHEAGNDLTESMEIAPHADDVMERFKAIGILIP